MFIQLLLNLRREAASAFSKNYAQRDSFTRQTEAANVLGATNDVAGYLDAVRNTVGPDGKPLGYRGAWESFDKNVGDTCKLVLLSQTDLDNMKGSAYSW